MSHAPLEIVSAQELLERPVREIPWLIEGFLASGLTILAGSPKVGKSWLVLSVAIAVARGDPFWGMPTAQADVLYLSLEDTEGRMARRLRALGAESVGHLSIATSSETLDGGLIEQMEEFQSQHPLAMLYIIDTLGAIRPPRAFGSAYERDYEDLRAFKRFADRHDVTVLVVHHTRKMGASDPLDTVTGTHGIVGVADEVMVLRRDRSGDATPTLVVDGRDVDYSEYRCKMEGGRWVLVERISDEEITRRSVAAAVIQTADFFLSLGVDKWSGTATQLHGLLPDPQVRPNVLTMRLNQHRDYLESRGICFRCTRTRTCRSITLSKIAARGHPTEEGDGGDAVDIT